MILGGRLHATQICSKYLIKRHKIDQQNEEFICFPINNSGAHIETLDKTLEARPINSEKLSQCKILGGLSPQNEKKF